MLQDDNTGGFYGNDGDNGGNGYSGNGSGGEGYGGYGEPVPINDYAVPPAAADDAAETVEAEYGAKRPAEPAWSDPNYSQEHETVLNMYTPGGIPLNNAVYRDMAAGGGETEKERKRPGRAGRFFRAACLILVCVLLSGAAAYGVMEYRISRGDFKNGNQVVLGGAPSVPSDDNIYTAPINTPDSVLSGEDIYTIACSQVVTITTTMGDEEGMNDVFGGYSQGGAAVTGSGFIISHDGYILTNNHVVETAYQTDLPLKVKLYDGSEYDAEVIGYEGNNDVALIKIEADGLSPVVIADSSGIKVGQNIYVVGNPLGELVYSMTDGIISALDREVSVENKMIKTFQFSAAVNSGNSGGPVYNDYGEVIGIVTAKPSSVSVEGIGFAIPINDAIQIASELIEHGYLSGRPFMGITVQSVSATHSNYYGWGVVGAYVVTVTEDSAADKAGINAGDIIINLDGNEIDSRETLTYVLRQYSAGDTKDITVWRNSEKLELSITFDENTDAGRVDPEPEG